MNTKASRIGFAVSGMYLLVVASCILFALASDIRNPTSSVGILLPMFLTLPLGGILSFYIPNGYPLVVITALMQAAILYVIVTGISAAVISISTKKNE